MNKRVSVVILEEDYLLKDSLINKINDSQDYEVITAFENGVQCVI